VLLRLVRPATVLFVRTGWEIIVGVSIPFEAANRQSLRKWRQRWCRVKVRVSVLRIFCLAAAKWARDTCLRLVFDAFRPRGRVAQSLKTAVNLILNSQHAMGIGWGPAKTYLYNDAYVHVLGTAKHEWALGRPASEVWAETWHIIGPLAEKVFREGAAAFVDDMRLFMSRGDFLEETYYSYSYSPSRDESGQVGGLFCPSIDVTPKVVNARRYALQTNWFQGKEKAAFISATTRGCRNAAGEWTPCSEPHSRAYGACSGERRYNARGKRSSDARERLRSEA
jgi:PAS domain-containing protein